MPSAVSEFEVARLEKKIGELDDVKLLRLMFIFLNGDGREWGEQADVGARVAFAEVGMRWIPVDLFAQAFAEFAGIVDEGDGGDAS